MNQDEHPPRIRMRFFKPGLSVAVLLTLGDGISVALQWLARLL